MSAKIPNTMLMYDLLKPTGYDCPDNLQNKTFREAVAGEGGTNLQEKTVSVVKNGTQTVTPDLDYGGLSKVNLNVAVSSDVKIQDTKFVSIYEPKVEQIKPDAGFDALAEVNVMVDVTPAKPEQTKAVEITTNGTTTVIPDTDKVLSSISINVDVKPPANFTYYAYLRSTDSGATWNPTPRYLPVSSMASDADVAYIKTHWRRINGEPKFFARMIDSKNSSTVNQTLDYGNINTAGEPSSFIEKVDDNTFRLTRPDNSYWYYKRGLAEGSNYPDTVNGFC